MLWLAVGFGWLLAAVAVGTVRVIGIIIITLLSIAIGFYPVIKSFFSRDKVALSLSYLTTTPKAVEAVR